METDQKVQTTIRKEFPNSTVIMIAHRLQTVIDCDKIVVMKNGSIIEVGHPFELLAKYFTYNEDELTTMTKSVNNTSILVNSSDNDKNFRDSFASMVSETGQSMSKYLLKKSSESFHRIKKSASTSSELHRHSSNSSRRVSLSKINTDGIAEDTDKVTNEE